MTEEVLTYDGLVRYHRNITDYVDRGDENSKTYADIVDSNTNVRIDEIENELDNIVGLTLQEIDLLTPIN